MTKYERNRYYCFMIVLYANATMIVDIVRYLAVIVSPGLANMIELARNVIYIGCTLYVVWLFVRFGMYKWDLLLVCGSVLLFLVSDVITPGISSFWLSAMMLFYSRVLIGWVLFEHVNAYDKLAEMQSKFLVVTLIYTTMVLTQTKDNYMTMSYNLMPPALFNVFYGLQKKKKLYTIAGFISFAMAGIYGSRGALLGGGIAIILYMILSMSHAGRRVSYRQMFAIVGVSVAIVLVYVSWDQIVNFLLGQFSASRTLMKILRGTLTDDSGRSDVYDVIINAIKQEPLLPHGLLADRIVVAGASGLLPAYSTYPHNIVYEMLYQFGTPLGFIILIAILGLLVRTLICSKYLRSENFIFFLAFVPVAFSQLMVSSSYLISWPWGIAMGILFSGFRKT